jgi:hypothetical protein
MNFQKWTCCADEFSKMNVLYVSSFDFIVSCFLFDAIDSKFIQFCNCSLNLASHHTYSNKMENDYCQPCQQSSNASRSSPSSHCGCSSSPPSNDMDVNAECGGQRFVQMFRVWLGIHVCVLCVDVDVRVML